MATSLRWGLSSLLGVSFTGAARLPHYAPTRTGRNLEISSTSMPDDDHDQTDDDDRLVIPLDPEVALRALLEVDPKQMPPDDTTPAPEKKSSS
jgi:hypothetical protein